MSDLRIDAHGNVFLWEWPETGWSIARVTDLDWLDSIIEGYSFGPIGSFTGFTVKPYRRDDTAWFLLFVGDGPSSLMNMPLSVVDPRKGIVGDLRGKMGSTALGFEGDAVAHARAWIEFFVEYLVLDPWMEMVESLLISALLEYDSSESLDSAMLDMREARRQGRSPTGVPILDVDLFLLLDEPPPPLWPLDEFLEFVRQVARG